MITLMNISKSHGERRLLDGVNLQINSGEKIGLIGPNGAGKSTLFSIILGQTEASEGSVQTHKGLRIGYLPQETRFLSERTVLTEVTEGHALIEELRKEKKELEHTNQAHLSRYGDILHELEFLGYFKIEHKAKMVLAGLGFAEDDFDRSITAMSGG